MVVKVLEVVVRDGERKSSLMLSMECCPDDIMTFIMKCYSIEGLKVEINLMELFEEIWRVENILIG